MSSSQGSLFGGDSFRQQKLRDFRLIPEGIWPTATWMLHQGTDVLVYRNTDAAKGISKAQHRLFSTLSRLGDHPDAPGSIQVLACTGLAGVTFDRQIAIYDHMHNDEKLRLAGEQEIELYIRDWFRARQRGGR